MFSELAFPHIRCCLSAIPSDLMKSTAVDESLSTMNQQFCSREKQLLQLLLENGKSTQKLGALYKILRSFAKPEDNNPLPDINKERIPDEFANYFLNKIEKSWTSLMEMLNIHHLLDPALNY